jgi:hypothetical protein
MFDFINRLKSRGSSRSTSCRRKNAMRNRRFQPRLEVLEDRVALSGFVWQNAWEVTFEESGYLYGALTAFGSSATTNGEIKDIGQAGDEGPASAAARASVVANQGDGEGLARVSFSRTFELSGSATGWNVALEALLSGTLDTNAYGNGYALASVQGGVRIVEGGITGPSLMSLGFYYDCYSDSYPCQLNVSTGDAQQHVAPDGVYTVIGSLESQSTRFQERPGGDGWGESAFFNPPGLIVNVDATPWDGAPLPSISINDVSITEGHTGTTAASFAVTLSAASNHTVSVEYTTANGTAAAGDYQPTSGTLIIPAGQTVGMIIVPVNSDRLAEPNETFLVNLSGATNATIADGQGVGTIVDDEPRISISDVTKAEGKKGQTTLFTFTVTISAAYDQAVTISFGTVNGTATSSSGDYIARSGTLTFNSGETTKEITIQVKGDSKKEANETFFVGLFGNSSNVLITQDRGIGSILNDD